MVTLPYDFDTTTPWQRIVKITVAICVAILAFMVRLVARFPGLSFGARGRLTAAEIETRPVSVYGIPLRVPVGRYAISQFAGVRVVQRIIVIRPSNARSNEDIG